MSGITIYEFDALAAAGPNFGGVEGLHVIPESVFGWLETQCLQAADQGDVTWLRLAHRRGRRVVQVTSFVGVIRAPDGYQIEVLPKVGKAIGGGAVEARQLLIEMLCFRASGTFRPTVPSSWRRACHCWKSLSQSSCVR
jgi:5-methylcytosine-specific restriction enzyme subunit McrC